MGDMTPDTIEMNNMATKSGCLDSSQSHRNSRTKSDLESFHASLSNRMGKPVALNRNFGSLSILALSITLLASWESVASGFVAGLENGGPVSLVWGFLFSVMGTMAMATSMAEMASICPIAGAQYHWTALFAPQKIKNLATWLQGWVTVFAWQAAVTSIVHLVARQIQGLVVLNRPSYEPERWHVMLLMWAVLLLNFAINVYGIQFLPIIQLMGGIFHIAFFVMLVVPMVLLAPRSTPEFVFTQVINEGGYESDGISWCLGLLTSVYCFLGFDGAIHMAEEVRDAATVIPQILVQSIAINGGLAFAFMLVMLFCIGNVDTALHSSTGLPIIEILYQATGSKPAATAMLCLINVIGLTSSLGVVASVSRLTWAFARDGGLPYSTFFAKIDAKHHVPFRSVGLVCVTVVILSLIQIASTTALQALLALTTVTLYISYLIPIILLVHKRRTAPESINFGPWTLGRWGMPINLFAIAFGTLIVVFMPWPTHLPVTKKNMNYAAPVLGGLLVFLGIDWAIRGRKHFRGPLKELLDPTGAEREARRNS